MYYSKNRFSSQKLRSETQTLIIKMTSLRSISLILALILTISSAFLTPSFLPQRSTSINKPLTTRQTSSTLGAGDRGLSTKKTYNRPDLADEFILYGTGEEESWNILKGVMESAGIVWREEIVGEGEKPKVRLFFEGTNSGLRRVRIKCCFIIARSLERHILVDSLLVVARSLLLGVRRSTIGQKKRTFQSNANKVFQSFKYSVATRILRW